MSEQQPDEIEGKWGDKSIRARGTDLMMILVVLVCTVNAAFMYMHMDDAKKTGETVAGTNREVAAALKESNLGFAKALQELVRSQNLSTCILATKEDQKEAEYMKPNSFCNRMTK